MTADTQQLYRERLKGKQPPAARCNCNRVLRSNFPGGLCRACWWATPAGLADKRAKTLERTRKARSAAKDRAAAG
ncbi:MAG: hypothetical protein N3Z28_10155 [Synechococcaceae cyanobacterium MAG-AL2]|uniref:hypothetical protein n=1 Tax=Candidatus Regnicoccus frigidus TaxID=3074015 RepID=UPI0028192808|nr:hypothetical protein [Candidatus Regnicoccus frigidus]MCT4368016.1 hypothetical protein [Candidatus Regnicoccus frigidus MAG-AL2]